MFSALQLTKIIIRVHFQYFGHQSKTANDSKQFLDKEGMRYNEKELILALADYVAADWQKQRAETWPKFQFIDRSTLSQHFHFSFSIFFINWHKLGVYWQVNFLYLDILFKLALPQIFLIDYLFQISKHSRAGWHRSGQTGSGCVGQS